MKHKVRLSESDLHRIVKETVKKVLKESEENSVRDYWREAEDNYLMQEKLPKGWEKYKNEDVFGGFIYVDNDYNEYYKDEYGHFQPLDDLVS